MHLGKQYEQCENHAPTVNNKNKVNDRRKIQMTYSNEILL